MPLNYLMCSSFEKCSIEIKFAKISEQLDILRKSPRTRHGGFAPALSDEEIITIERREILKLSVRAWLNFN